MKKTYSYREYWEKNIDKWAELYLHISHGDEELLGPKIFTKIYNKFVVPLESRLMKTRYELTIDFLERYLEEGDTLCDVGCGTGVFTVSALRKGASKVVSVDIASASLEATKENVSRHVPDKIDQVSFLLADIQLNKIPRTDIALVVGVLPYIANLSLALADVLPQSGICFLQYSSAFAMSNIVRRFFPVLNVRKLQFHNPHYLESLISDCGHRIVEKRKFATGYLLTTMACRKV